MASNRPTKTTEYLRYSFTESERLTMGSELAQSHNTLAQIAEEETTVKAQFKERRSTTEGKIGSLSRKLALGYEMRNIPCRIEYDKPNLNEVSYIREDTGEVVKTRPFTDSERQQDLPLDVVPAEQPGVVSDQLVEAVSTFFHTEAVAPELEPGGEVDQSELLYDSAVIAIRRHTRITATTLQRELKIGYAAAVHILDRMQQDGLIGPANGSQSREVLQDAPKKPTIN